MIIRADQQLPPGMKTATLNQPTPPDRFISITRARCVARYRMHNIPGRPEELATNQEPFRTISVAYSGGEMRIRKHGGARNRDWIETRDFRLRDGWLDEVYEFLDEFLDYPPGTSIQPV